MRIGPGGGGSSSSCRLNVLYRRTARIFAAAPHPGGEPPATLETDDTGRGVTRPSRFCVDSCGRLPAHYIAGGALTRANALTMSRVPRWPPQTPLAMSRVPS
jgi:hypothetical protein